jgi:lipopolysaccharide export system protein LptA
MIRFCLAVLASFVWASSSYAVASSPIGAKMDTKLPIEISSDSLEVLQHDNKAIFKGNVIAVQGTLRLKSDVMIVHYHQKNEQSAQPPKPKSGAATPAGSAANAMGAISLIEVEGNVFVATPEESAKGDKGDYNADSKLLHLFGTNVVLTRDKNILRGTALEYNLETGRSILTNGADTVSGKTNGGRVHTVFVPNQDDKKPVDKK